MRFKSILIVCLSLSQVAFAQKEHWILPDFGVVQHWGSIGYLSAGLGYDVFESKARLSAHYGIVPVKGGGTVNIASVKLFFTPAKVLVWNRISMNPADLGLMASYHYGKDFGPGITETSHERYWWRPALRAHLGMENSVTYEFKKDHPLRSVTAYIEFNTNEQYFLSFIRNMSDVKFRDIIQIGTGARVHF